MRFLADGVVGFGVRDDVQLERAGLASERLLVHGDALLKAVDADVFQQALVEARDGLEGVDLAAGLGIDERGEEAREEPDPRADIEADRLRRDPGAALLHDLGLVGAAVDDHAFLVDGRIGKDFIAVEHLHARGMFQEKHLQGPGPQKLIVDSASASDKSRRIVWGAR